MGKKNKNKTLDFSSGMKPKIQEKERNIMTDKPLSRTKSKILRFRQANFNKI